MTSRKLINNIYNVNICQTTLLSRMEQNTELMASRREKKVHMKKEARDKIANEHQHKKTDVVITAHQKDNKIQLWDLQADKIISIINLNKQPNFITKIDSVFGDDMVHCISKVTKHCPNIVVMLLSANVEEANSMDVGVAYPANLSNKLDTWLSNSISTVVVNEAVKSPIIFIQQTVSHINDTDIVMDIKTQKISYPLIGEHFAFKYIDQVIGNAFSELRKLDLYKDDSDGEKEYDFDDI